MDHRTEVDRHAILITTETYDPPAIQGDQPQRRFQWRWAGHMLDVSGAIEHHADPGRDAVIALLNTSESGNLIEHITIARVDRRGSTDCQRRFKPRGMHIYRDQ